MALTEFTDLFSVHFNISYIIFKYSRHIDLRELVLTKNYEQARFTARTITHNHEFLSNGRHVSCKSKYVISFFYLLLPYFSNLFLLRQTQTPFSSVLANADSKNDRFPNKRNKYSTSVHETSHFLKIFKIQVELLIFTNTF